jgi:hypothetical protein
MGSSCKSHQGPLQRNAHTASAGSASENREICEKSLTRPGVPAKQVEDLPQRCKTMRRPRRWSEIADHQAVEACPHPLGHVEPVKVAQRICTSQQTVGRISVFKYHVCVSIISNHLTA